MKFGFVAKYRDVWSVRWLCAALGVTCAGFYAWLKRPRSTRACLDEALTASIHGALTVDGLDILPSAPSHQSVVIA